MSIVLIGMEMPKEKCLWLCIKTDGTVYNIKPGGIGTAHAVGTAIPLPEGRGRLIDADAFLATIRPLCTEDAQAACTLETVKRLMAKRIRSAPTVVPKEGGVWYG